MATFKYTCYTTWQVTCQSSQEFDISDQDAWEDLRSGAKEYYDDDDFNKRYPKKAPKNPELWLELFNLYEYYAGDNNTDNGEWDYESRELEGTIEDEAGAIVASS
jgi:hypothetical protein